MSGISAAPSVVCCCRSRSKIASNSTEVRPMSAFDDRVFRFGAFAGSPSPWGKSISDMFVCSWSSRIRDDLFRCMRPLYEKFTEPCRCMRHTHETFKKIRERKKEKSKRESREQQPGRKFFTIAGTVQICYVFACANKVACSRNIWPTNLRIPDLGTLLVSNQILPLSL